MQASISLTDNVYLFFYVSYIVVTFFFQIMKAFYLTQRTQEVCIGFVQYPWNVCITYNVTTTTIYGNIGYTSGSVNIALHHCNFTRNFKVLVRILLNNLVLVFLDIIYSKMHFYPI